MAERKEYRSAVRSRRMIREAFKELLHEKKFEKITVTDIVNRADLNRSTFYAHYPDVQGLVDEMLDDVVTRSIQLVSGMEFRQIYTDPMPFLQGLTSIATENTDIYRILGRSDFALKQIEKVKSVLLESAVNSVDIPVSIRTSTSFRIQVSFFIGGILNVYQQWIQGDLDCSVDEIVEQIATQILSNSHTYKSWEDQ